MRSSLILTVSCAAVTELLQPFQLPFVQRGLVEVLLLSIVAGTLGSWIVLRGFAFFSHAVGTAAFPGLVLADGLGFGAPLGALGAALVFTIGDAALGRPPGGGRPARRARRGGAAPHQATGVLAACRRAACRARGDGRALALGEDRRPAGSDDRGPLRRRLLPRSAGTGAGTRAAPPL